MRDIYLVLSSQSCKKILVIANINNDDDNEDDDEFRLYIRICTNRSKTKYSSLSGKPITEVNEAN